MDRTATADREKAADGGGFEEWGFDDKVGGGREAERIGESGHEWDCVGGARENYGGGNGSAAEKWEELVEK